MAEIIPAIIADSFQELKDKLSQVEGLVSWAQIDVMDGKFVEPTTWRTPKDLEKLRVGMHLEAHLMVFQPERTIDEWLASPVRRILLHYESTSHAAITQLAELISLKGKEVGIALKLATPLFVLDPLLHDSHFKLHVVQLMGISEIGYYGHAFEEKTLERIAALREKYPDVTIEVDGGVNLKNAASIVKAGADRLVAGSAIFKSGDIKGTIEKFNAALTRRENQVS